jgi:hypothetical protein
MKRLFLMFASLLVMCSLVAVSPIAYAQEQDPAVQDPAVQDPAVQEEPLAEDPAWQEDPDRLPATASPLPLLALIGAGMLGFGLIKRRR